MDIITDLKNMNETLWENPHIIKASKAIAECSLKYNDIVDAEKRLLRFAPMLAKAFPDTDNGIIESPVVKTDSFAQYLGAKNVYMKLDSHLPVSGSIKARGGIYEVLKTTEAICFKEGILKETDDYSVILDDEHRKVLSTYSIGVGSTGNLGLSIGIMAAKLGYKVTVHMSSDARQWKKDKLRSCGCIVREYESDYSVAVRQGREEAKNDSKCHFVDDENSVTLFLGYAVAALRLEKQLKDMNITVDDTHPLYVYLPCGVGGGPGGVAFGIKQIFGDNAHCYFAEPTHSPCMTLGMASGKQNDICVADIGLDNRTQADGLAVGRASGFVGNIMMPFISGCFTVTDERMFVYLKELAKREKICLEPSALAGVRGVILKKDIPNATHLVWATGGSMVPEDIMNDYLNYSL